MKSIQISYEMFLKLMRYFFNNQTEYEDDIMNYIEDKMTRLANRERYSKAMAAQSDEERRKLLEEYFKYKHGYQER